MTHLGVEYKHNTNRLYGICPIHLGDSGNAFSIYLDSGIWRCFTHACHETWGGDLIGLIRGLLSDGNEKQQISRKDTINYLCKWCGVNTEELYQFVDTEQLALVQTIKTVYGKFQDCKNVNSSQIEVDISVPSEYYISRNYSTDILKKYGIGDCKIPGHFFSNRALIPIYSSNKQVLLGYSARTIIGQEPKWLHSKNLHTHNLLYNLWYAKEYIQKENTIIIVESPGNVLKLEEYGIHNSVAVFGTKLHESQKYLINQLGVHNAIILFDNDTNKAGQKGAAKAQKMLNHLNSKVLFTTKNDIADSTIEEIYSLLGASK